LTELFQSFFLAGFEASTQRRRDGVRVDVVEATRHDELAEADYARMLRVGIRTAREGTAWHRIEAQPGRFDFSSAIRRVQIAQRLGVQVIWDLCHFGWPDDVDPFAAAFPDRLGRFARVFARLLAAETDAVPWYAPVNEISFVAWAAGDVEYLNPFARGRGDELKRQLVRAALAASDAVRSVDPRARIVHIDPLIHIEPNPAHPERGAAVAAYNEIQYAAWDMLAGRLEPELGGSAREIDVIGVNFYDRNQWVDLGPTLTRADAGYRPLRAMLHALGARYGVPVLMAETGAEGAERVPWLRYVCDEVAAARAGSTAVEGICLYPVMDHPGWDNDRHIEVGLWGYPDAAGDRPTYTPLADELSRQQARFDPDPVEPVLVRAAP
jgi:hypothetical protein